MFEFNVTSAVLMAFIAAILALVFDYFPGLAGWFNGLAQSNKKLFMAGLLIVAAVIVFLGSCYGWFVTNLVCEAKTIITLIYELVIAVSVNQGVHFLSKPSATLKARMFGFTPPPTVKGLRSK